MNITELFFYGVLLSRTERKINISDSFDKKRARDSYLANVFIVHYLK